MLHVIVKVFFWFFLQYINLVNVLWHHIKTWVFIKITWEVALDGISLALINAIANPAIDFSSLSSYSSSTRKQRSGESWMRHSVSLHKDSPSEVEESLVSGWHTDCNDRSRLILMICSLSEGWYSLIVYIVLLTVWGTLYTKRSDPPSTGIKR